MIYCNGKGECLVQSNTGEYDKDNNTTCVHNCKPIICPNYILCNTEYPEWVGDRHNGLCANCNIMFGTWNGRKGILNIINDVECPICLETVICISQPKCDHSLCINCFKRCHYGKEEPIFPYPEIEDDYYDNPNNEKWKEYLNINKYESAYNIWEREKDEEQGLLSRCPLCRK